MEIEKIEISFTLSGLMTQHPPLTQGHFQSVVFGDQFGCKLAENEAKNNRLFGVDGSNSIVGLYYVGSD